MILFPSKSCFRGFGGLETSRVRSGVSSGVRSGVSGGVSSRVRSGVRSGLRSGVRSGVSSGVRSGVSSGVRSGVRIEWVRSGVRIISCAGCHDSPYTPHAIDFSTSLKTFCSALCLNRLNCRVLFSRNYFKNEFFFSF